MRDDDVVVFVVCGLWFVVCGGLVFVCLCLLLSLLLSSYEVVFIPVRGLFVITVISSFIFCFLEGVISVVFARRI